MVYNINGGSLNISEMYEYAENDTYGTSGNISEYTVPWAVALSATRTPTMPPEIYLRQIPEFA